jgi:hypothetical protein
MSLLWAAYKRRNKPRQCIHHEQSIQRLEPAESTTFSATLKTPKQDEPRPHHVASGDPAAVDPSNVEEHHVQQTARDPKGRCQTCRQEKLAARHYRIRLIIGIFFPFALQALDTTIVASALPWIASDFSKYSDTCVVRLLILSQMKSPR